MNEYAPPSDCDSELPIGENRAKNALTMNMVCFVTFSIFYCSLQFVSGYLPGSLWFLSYIFLFLYLMCPLMFFILNYRMTKGDTKGKRVGRSILYSIGVFMAVSLVFLLFCFLPR
jgi:hypothetical protein